MLDWLLEISAPSSFSFWAMQYQRKNYQIALKWISLAIKWSPQLKEDPIVMAYSSLTEYRLGDNKQIENFTAIFAELSRSKYKEIESYQYALEEIQRIVNTNRSPTPTS